MPYDSNGNFTLVDTYFVENGDTVLPIQHNPPLEDIQAALSSLLVRDGRAPMTGNLNMGNKKIIALADATAASDAATKGQLDQVALRYVVKAANYKGLVTDSAALLWFTGAAPTLTLDPAATLLANWYILIKAAGGDVTIDPDGTELVNGSATAVVKKGSLGLLVCDGTGFKLHTEFVASSDFLGGFRDKLINGAGEINIRSYTTVADDTYWCDRNYILTQTAAITPTILQGVSNGLPYMMRLTQSQAAAQRMGNAQIIEASVAQRLRGKQVTLGGKLRCSSSQPIRFAVLEWFGTSDVPVSDVVSNWGSGSFTAGSFFLGSNLGVVAVGSITPAANTITDWSLVGNIAASNNIIVMMWTEGTAAQNVTLDMTWGLVVGDASAETWPYEMRSPQQERGLCERYCEDGAFGWYGNTASAGSYSVFVNYRTIKRTTPTLSGADQGASGFPAGAPTFSVVDGLRSFRATKTANTTGTPSSFTFTYLADCEL